MSATLTTPNIVEPEQRLVLSGIGWGQYVTISDALPDWHDLRMIYIDRRLTFLVTSRRHDWLSECLGHLVVAVAGGSGILWEPAGRVTFRREDRGSGVEGDSTYYFGENAERMLGPQNIDLTIQPPPRPGDRGRGHPSRRRRRGGLGTARGPGGLASGCQALEARIPPPPRRRHVCPVRSEPGSAVAGTGGRPRATAPGRGDRDRSLARTACRLGPRRVVASSRLLTIQEGYSHHERQPSQ